MIENYRELYELTNEENVTLKKVVKTQESVIRTLEKENKAQKGMIKALNTQLDKVMGICDRQERILAEMLQGLKSDSQS